MAFCKIAKLYLLTFWRNVSKTKSDSSASSYSSEDDEEEDVSNSESESEIDSYSDEDSDRKKKSNVTRHAGSSGKQVAGKNSLKRPAGSNKNLIDTKKPKTSTSPTTSNIIFWIFC